MRKLLSRATSAAAILGLLAAVPAMPGFAASTAGAQVSVPLIPRDALFGNPSRAQGRISPDGKYLSWLAPVDGVLNIWVAPASDPSKARAITKEAKRALASYAWAPDSRHVLYIRDENGDENYRVYSVNVETAALKALTEAKPKVRAQLAGVSRFRPDAVLIGLNDRDPQLFDLYEVNYRTGESKLIEKNPGFGGYTADNLLRPRFATKQVPGGAQQVFRRTDSGEWVEAYQVPADDVFNTAPIGFNRANDAIYMLDSRGRDTAALVKMDAATGKTTVLATDDRADVAGLVVDPVTFEPLGYSSNYLKNEWTALDPSFKADLAFLEGKLPGELAFASATDDGSRVVVVASAAEQPATYYLFDRKARTVTKMFDTRPDLADAPLQPMHAVVIPSRDSLNLVSYLTLPTGSDPDGDGVPNAPVPMVL
jgi:dipeptidyl aminopeptidase/acylaminoacyl peptidase